MFVKRHGTELELYGRVLDVGDRLPVCTLHNSAGEPFDTSQMHGWTLLSIMSTISPGVCDASLMAFHHVLRRYERLGVYAIVLAESTMLANWCGNDGNEHLTLLADDEMNFGKATALLIPNVAVLARSLYIIGPDARVRFRDIAAEQTELPDFGPALAFLDTVFGHYHKLQN